MADRMSSQDRRLNRLGSLSEINARNTAAGAAESNNMMQQLMQMYQLAQSQEMDPLKAEALKLANQEQSFKNDWAQPNAEMQYNLGNAQAQAMQQRASGAPQPSDWLDYFGRMQMPVPPEFSSIMPPEVRAAQAAELQKKEAAKQAALQQIEQQKNSKPPGSTDQPLGQSIMNTPAVLLNGAASGLEYLAGTVGAKPDFGRMMGPGDIYYNYMMKGLEPPASMIMPGPNAPITPSPPGPSAWEQFMNMLSKTYSPAMPAPRLP